MYSTWILFESVHKNIFAIGHNKRLIWLIWKENSFWLGDKKCKDKKRDPKEFSNSYVTIGCMEYFEIF